MGIEHRTATRCARSVVLVTAVSLALAACGTSESTLAERYPTLEDSVGFSACLRKTGNGPNRLMANMGTLTTDEDASPGELPADIVFRDVIGDSPAGFDFEPVALLTTGTTYYDLLLDQRPDAADDTEFATLPYAPGPDREKTISIGVIVDIPEAGPFDPPAAIELNGFEYETGGETYTYDADVEVWVSRQSEDGAWCSAFNCSMFTFEEGCPPGGR